MRGTERERDGDRGMAREGGRGTWRRRESAVKREPD